MFSCLKEVRSYNSKGVESFVEYRLSRVLLRWICPGHQITSGNSLNSTCDSTQFLEELKEFIMIKCLIILLIVEWKLVLCY
jgi:hypothetical protein